jgi:hypothetical protein
MFDEAIEPFEPFEFDEIAFDFNFLDYFVLDQPFILPPFVQIDVEDNHRLGFEEVFVPNDDF